ncbi:MAG: tetratricopeptide repeat protein [Candidatus Latescibacteria bacterium]|jgi:tetratricopeptide (TPR) repeat protein|nr:tetratricopeptide repeat protein [Candidatus Latescibacterota bacterium]
MSLPCSRLLLVLTLTFSLAYISSGCAARRTPGPTIVVVDDRSAPDPPILKSEEEQARRQLSVMKDLLKKDDRNAKLQFEVGLLEARLGHWDAARSKFKKALDLDPRYADAQYQIGLTWEHSGEMYVITKGRTVLPLQRERAIEAYQKAIVMDSYLADAHYRLAVLALMDENIEIARKAIDDLARIEPESRRSHEMLAKLTEIFRP